MTDLLCETGLTRALCRNGRDSQLLLEEEGGREGGRVGGGEGGKGGTTEVNREKERTRGRELPSSTFSPPPLSSPRSCAPLTFSLEWVLSYGVL